PRRAAIEPGLQLRLRARDGAAVAQPLARRPGHPHVAGQHRHRTVADGAGNVAGVRAHPGRDDEWHEPRRLALPRPGDPLDQLFPRRRRAPRVPARLLRNAAEPRVRRAAGGRSRPRLALHADRDARHDRVLSVADPIAKLRDVLAASRPAPAEMTPYLETVRDRAYAVVDRDIEALREAGISEDTIFEQTV